MSAELKTFFWKKGMSQLDFLKSALPFMVALEPRLPQGAPPYLRYEIPWNNSNAKIPLDKDNPELGSEFTFSEKGHAHFEGIIDIWAFERGKETDASYDVKINFYGEEAGYHLPVVEECKGFFYHDKNLWSYGRYLNLPPDKLKFNIDSILNLYRSFLEQCRPSKMISYSVDREVIHQAYWAYFSSIEELQFELSRYLAAFRDQKIQRHPQPTNVGDVVYGSIDGNESTWEKEELEDTRRRIDQLLEQAEVPSDDKIRKLISKREEWKALPFGGWEVSPSYENWPMHLSDLILDLVL